MIQNKSTSLMGTAKAKKEEKKKKLKYIILKYIFISIEWIRESI